MSDPVLIHFNRGRSLWLGGVLCACAFIWSAISLLILSAGIDVTFGFLLAFGIGPLVALLGLWHIGVALKRPVALRMDAKGISGFCADPATWNEIARIDTITGEKGHKFLGFSLCDPIGFRDRQTPWRRFTSWRNGRHNGLHIIVPEVLLQNASTSTLAQQASALHRKATT